MSKVVNYKKHIKIPNFFGNEDNLFINIGGRDGFVIYCMFISNQNMLGEIFTSTTEINYYLNLDKNSTRARDKILSYLMILKNNRLIDFDFKEENILTNSFFKIQCLNVENNYTYDNLVSFYEDDFVIYDKLGTTPYCVMWVLRMLEDKNTNITRVNISKISRLLKCNTRTVIHTINIFEDTKLFDVIGRDSYYNTTYNKKTTNEYKYLGNFEKLLSMSSEVIKRLVVDGMTRKSKKTKIEVFKEGEDCTDKYGIYFIYDNHDDLAYIGKSITCILKRSLQSAEERELYDFSKIELKPTKTQSDIDIYEKYYIQHYKPYCNNDGVYNDVSTIKLPEIATKQIMYNKN